MWVGEMYGDLKGHGFDLEASQLKQTDRIGRLFLGFGIVFVWLITRGNWVVKRGYRHLVAHKSRGDKSCFRLGKGLGRALLCSQLPHSAPFQTLFFQLMVNSGKINII